MDSLEQVITSGRSSGLKFRNGISILASVTVSFLILYGITRAQKTEMIDTSTDFEELRSVVLPPPPPPPPQGQQSLKAPPSLLNLEISHEDSPVQLSYSPTPLTPVISPPVIEPVFDFSPDAFKPSLENYEASHVYSKAEVDQPPVVVYKKVPGFNLELMGENRYAKVSLMYIVNTQGTVEAVSLVGSGGEQFDQVIMDAVRKWRFKPAIKDGNKVNCWVRQRVILKNTGGSSRFYL